MIILREKTYAYSNICRLVRVNVLKQDTVDGESS